MRMRVYILKQVHISLYYYSDKYQSMNYKLFEAFFISITSDVIQ